MLVVHGRGVAPSVLQELTTGWSDHHFREPVFRSLEKVGRFSEVDLEFGDAWVDPAAFRRGPVSGPDHLELELGNLFVYSVVLWEADTYYRDLRDRWLPYYDERLRTDRLAAVLGWFRNSLAHIEPFARRGFHLACIKRIHLATEEFLQALFISRRVYPIAYDKHVQEQVTEILGEPGLYPRLMELFQIERLDTESLAGRVRMLEDLMSSHVRPP